ncbi:MAG: response regulator [Acidobacteriota bacterium]|nr:response regulator [Acidobacteriota bacterium]
MKSRNVEHSGQVETILLVDDEPGVRRLVREMLTMSGFTVYEASGGLEALRLALGLKQPLNMLVTDIIMPQMDGHELARELARLHPATRVLFMSGYSTDSNIKKVTAIGGRCIPKPFSMEDLTRTIREMLDTPWAGLSLEGSKGASK